jgi:hypothetical protein
MPWPVSQFGRFGNGSPSHSRNSAKVSRRRNFLPNCGESCSPHPRSGRPENHARRNDPLPQLELVSIGLDDLKLPARKIRKCTPAHVRAVVGSISELGFCAPLLVGKDNLVLDGEIRVEAAKLLGLATVPCIRIDHLTDVEQRTLRLALNRLSEKGQWDLRELKIEFKELILTDAPIEISGFSLEEIFLDGRWFTFDARHNMPRIGRIMVARGRDATDIPLVTSFGPHILKTFQIWTDEVDAAALQHLNRRSA